MTAEQRTLLDALSGCTFGIGTASKRFVRDMAACPPDYEMSDRAERFAWRIAYHYRRQLPKTIAEEAVSRKVDHKWEPYRGVEFGRSPNGWRCSVCLEFMFGERQRNAPCPGPPPPPKPKIPRRTKTNPSTEVLL